MFIDLAAAYESLAVTERKGLYSPCGSASLILGLSERDSDALLSNLNSLRKNSCGARILRDACFASSSG
jgi:hypothetical protein